MDTHTSTGTKRALVVGCGLAGCATAWWLHESGWEVVLVDQRTDPYPSSYLLQLDNVAIDILRRMGAQDVIDRTTYPSPNTALRWCGQGKTRTLSFDTRDHRGEPWRLADRSPFLSAIFAHVPSTVDIRLGVRLDSLENFTDRVKAHFADGTADTFDVVVGADGLHSTVRELTLAPESASVYRNDVTHLWINVDEKLLDGQAILAARNRTALQIYPYRDPARTMILAALPVPAGTPLDHRALVDHVADTITHLGVDLEPIASAARASSDIKTTQFSQVRLSRWHTRRVVLLGDAAHCIDPLSGMGAHGALLGVVSLTAALQRYGSATTSAFTRYESEVRPFAESAQSVTARTIEYISRTQHRPRLTTVLGGLGDIARIIPSLLHKKNQRNSLALSDIRETNRQAA
ncbi:FAD-dependent oxidoreductase [Rhodococcus sp. CH91]|uniref:FAD-dependent oxidoreductase n=1 Tax=Rhodococcus sp. CH91 TaxID=2910256 RepID=UPI001F4AA6E7|nr:FAD-dependent monooxygenase [Rhodococcus sp. CH91]